MASNIRSSNEILTSEYLNSVAGLNRPSSRYNMGLGQPSMASVNPAYPPPQMTTHPLYSSSHLVNTTSQYLPDRFIGNFNNLNMNHQLANGFSPTTVVPINSSSFNSDSINESLLRKENEIER
jgi:hypothetical protein